MPRGLPKGRTNNPAGKPKGAKNKIQRNIVEQIVSINAELDKQGKGLKHCAEQDPKWYHSIFTRAIVPKDVNVQVDGDLRITWQSS
jgi:hypothetical protein